MKITFLQDHQSQMSGNSFYEAGTTADLWRGDELVALGVAQPGWGAPVFDAVEHREEIASEVIADVLPVDPAPAESVDFTVVKGISDEVRAALYGAGYLTWEDILQAGVVKIKDDVASVGMARARSLYAMAIREAQ